MKTVVILSHVTFDNSPYCIYVHEHAKALVKQGYHVVVFAIIHWFPILSHFQKYKKNFMKKMKGKQGSQIIDGVEVIYKKAMSFSNFLYNTKINLNGMLYYDSIKHYFKKINKKENIVLIDAQTFKVEGYVAYKLKRKYKNVTTLVTLHGTSFFRNTETKEGIKSIRKILNNVDYSICVSNKIQTIAKKIGVRNTRIIYNGINDQELEKVNKDDYKYNIISVGSLITGKKHDITINAISQLAKKYPQIKLNIVGTGNEANNLKDIVEKNKLEQIVCFKGQITNREVQEFINKSYIFLLPSINEGFGIVYAEAMKVGTITIGTKNEGIDGFIKNGENGFLVNPNINEIVNLIDDIYSNKYDLEKIRKNAYQDVSQLTWDNNAKKYLEILENHN